MPLISGGFVVGWTALWIWNFIMLVSTGKITQPTMGSQYKKIEFSVGQKQLMYLSVFMYFWILEFTLAVFQYNVIMGVCTWYFTSTQDTRGNFSLKRGFWYAFRYNQGSLALGSFLLAIIWVLRGSLEFLNRQILKLKGKSGIAETVIACTRCCLDCFHRFIKFLNKNAYIMMVLSGDNFCSSAMQACILSLKNSGNFFLANGIGAIIHSLGKVAISVANTGIGYLVITQVPSFQEDIDQPVPFLVLVFLMSFKLASSFMCVY